MNNRFSACIHWGCVLAKEVECYIHRKVPVLKFADVNPCIFWGALSLSVRLHASIEIHASGF